MRNLLSAEFYRMRKSRSFLIMSLVAFGVALALGFIMVAVVNLATGIEGMMLEEMGAAMTGSSALMTAFSANAGHLIWFVLAFLIIFVIGEFSGRTVQNSLAIGYGRAHYFGSKFILLNLFLATLSVLMIVGYIIPFLMSTPWGDAFHLGQFLGSFGLSYLIILGQATLFLGLSFWIPKTGLVVGLIAAMFVIDGALSFAFVFFDSVAVELIGHLFTAVPLVTASLVANGVADSRDVILALIFPMILIVGFVLIGVGTFSKKDI